MRFMPSVVVFQDKNQARRRTKRRLKKVFKHFYKKEGRIEPWEEYCDERGL